MSDIILEVNNLHKSFTIGDGQVEVLKGINVKIKQAEFVIIFGPSGCGKSTLLHCLLGLEEPTTGKILMDGKDYYSMTEDERALYRRHKVGMIYQQPLWVGALSVIENVCFPLHLLNIPDDEMLKTAENCLNTVGMIKWANYKPTELSSGQQQKISLARSLTTDPILIVADEPTGNLDTVSGRELLDTFMKLVEKGKTIIMVTHDLEYLRYATNIFHMVDGAVVEEVKPKKKFNVIGKKDGEGGFSTNVRDPELLKKLNL